MNRNFGTCRICKGKKELTFEHIPPRSAFNKSTRWKEIPMDKYYRHAHEYILMDKEPQGFTNQGGTGGYFLCNTCNNFLGSNYVGHYTELARIYMKAIFNAPNEAKALEIDVKGIILFKFFKRVVSIFICSNDVYFTERHAELLDFVKDPESEHLGDRYRFYMYLNKEGNLRNGNLMFTHPHGALCEFTFPPFGLVLTIDNPGQLMQLTEITALQKFKWVPQDQNPTLRANLFQTHYPFPLDYRDVSVIQKQNSKNP